MEEEKLVNDLCLSCSRDISLLMKSQHKKKELIEVILEYVNKINCIYKQNEIMNKLFHETLTCIPTNENYINSCLWKIFKNNIMCKIKSDYNYLVIEKIKIVERELYDEIYNKAYSKAYQKACQKIESEINSDDTKNKIYTSAYIEVYEAIRSEKYSEIVEQIQNDYVDDLEHYVNGQTTDTDNYRIIDELYRLSLINVKKIIATNKKILKIISDQIINDAMCEIKNGNFEGDYKIIVDKIINDLKFEIKKDQKLINIIEKRIINDVAESLFSNK